MGSLCSKLAALQGESVIFRQGTVICEGRLVDVLDKKSGAVILVDGRSAGRGGMSRWSLFVSQNLHGNTCVWHTSLRTSRKGR